MKSILVIFLMTPLLSLGTAEAQHKGHVVLFDNALEEVQINDNRKPAGEMRNGVYYINLEIREGNWYPESKEGAPIKIKALAEAGKPLQVPGPLIRVPEGTEIRARITNGIKDYPQKLYGLWTRPVERSEVAEGLLIAPGETKEVTFYPGPAGTYFYAIEDHKKDSFIPAARSNYFFPYLRSQAYGALIVDAKDELPDPQERIIMIGSAGVPSESKEEVATTWVLNGRSWPYTERLQYRQGETVKWRVINLSKFPHPMHLHGFPFTVTSAVSRDGNVVGGKENERLEVTHTLEIFEAMRISWIPEKTGNWLFHCHLANHILPLPHPGDQAKMDHASMDLKTHAANGMGGLIMGITILPGKNLGAKHGNIPERKLTLIVGEKKNYFDGVDGKGFQLIENGKPSAAGVSIPGPTLVLYKDEPVAIKIVNTLKEPTTIHWHGLEIESYYDGVAGWGNAGRKLAPLIPPGGSFTVHITPPRAGTFMYHTHMHDLQVLQGMYGPLVVLERGEKFDPVTDKIFLLSQGGKDLHMPTVFLKRPDHGFGEPKLLLNGLEKPEPLTLRKGQSYRFRFINIGADRGNRIPVSIKKDDQFAEWTPIAKDGMSLPDGQRKTASATQPIAIGETYDFQFIPATAGDYVLLVGNPGNPNAKPPIPPRIEITQLIKVVHQASQAGEPALRWETIDAPGLGRFRMAVATPAGPGPFPDVLLLHGTHGFAREYVDLARDLARGGVMAVAACWFRAGQGEGMKFITPEVCPDGTPPMVGAASAQAMRTVEALLNAVRALPQSRDDQVALFGHSRGGGAALSYMLQGGRTDAVIANSSGYGEPQPEQIAQLKSPILIFHGTAGGDPADGASELANVSRARKFEAAVRAAGKPIEAVYYPGGRHGSLFTDRAQREDSVRRILDFLRRMFGAK